MDSLTILAPDFDAASELTEQAGEQIAAAINKLKFKTAKVGWKGCDRPFRILSSMAIKGASSMSTSNARENGIDAIRPYLQDADEIRVLEFVKEKIDEGLIVIITSQIDDRCRFTSKSLRPERAFWTPAQFINYDYLRSWDVDRVGQPSQEYHQLRSLLDQDGYVSGYNYKLIRPDGALCEYQTDYYHVADGWCGEPVRIGVSRQDDYRVLVPAV